MIKNDDKENTSCQQAFGSMAGDVIN